jgi:ABC-type sugar transport system ATPase subunit
MDEPTSALNAQDAEKLFEVIDRLKAQGIGIVYISHKMDEIRRIADRITVLRDGRLIGAFAASDISDDRLIELMVGDKASTDSNSSSTPAATSDDVALTIDNLSVERDRRLVVQDASLSVVAGEVVGLAGLQGSGASELLQAIFGAGGKIVSGNIALFGRAYSPSVPRRAIAAGIAYLPNDRKTSGLVLPLSVAENAVLVGLPKLSPGGWRNQKREIQAAEAIARRFKVKAPTLDSPIAALSGGNQQKIALGKWLLNHPKILLLDEPTRGIDIGAKREIYALIDEWKRQGIAILLITSELPELLTLCNRILVMHRGRIVKQLSRQEATAEGVIHAAMDTQPNE